MGNKRERIVVVARPNLGSEIATKLRSAFAVILTPVSEAFASVAGDPDLAACLVDAMLPERATPALTDHLANAEPGLPTILVARASEHEAFSMSARLAVPVLLWPFKPRDLSDALANAHRRAIGRVARTLHASFDIEAREAALTPNEKSVTWMAILGATAKETASIRGVHVRTVEAQRYEVMKKLDVPSMDSLRWRLLRRVLPDWRKKP